MGRRKERQAVLLGSPRARADWEAVLSLEEGRRVVWAIISLDGVLEQNGALNSHALMAYNEGRRSLGQDVWDAVAAIDPNFIPLLMQGALNDQLETELSE